MKKIIRGIGKFFRHIGAFFDKWLITPITKLILKIIEFSKSNSKGIEKLLGKKQTLIVISLVLALAVFFIIDSEGTAMIDQYAEILYNQPVTATYNEEAYVVEGLPDTVDITLVGQKRHIFLAKQYPSGGVTVDLTGLKPGQHKVTLKYAQQLKSIDYRLDPSSVTVTIYDKVSQTKSLTYDILHQDNLDTKLSIDSVELDRSEVIVKGAEYKLEKVATVRALVDVDDFAKQEAGELTLDSVPLVAYDTNGKALDVEIVPKTVTAKVTISSPSKDVPIEIVPKGELAFGKAIRSLSTNVNTVTIYGSEDALDKIDSLEVEVDVTGLDADKDYTVTLKRPNGVTEISTKTITVKVAIDNSTTREFDNILIATENLGSGYSVMASSEEDSRVTVIVTGSESIINSIDPSIIQAYVDLDGLGVGEHEVEVKVRGDDVKLTYTPKTKTVKVRIASSNS
ncbi:MAG TPA: hypothetical protein IAB45_01265 [Candidatus Onthousia faecavium]|nr:hypothetical protein [Candidatus Onthousia faecavium]